MNVAKNIDWLDADVIFPILFSPIIEGLVFAFAILLARQLKTPNWLIVTFISLFAFFLHTSDLNKYSGFQAGVGFTALTILYIYVLDKWKKSHLSAYWITTTTHALYNFIGVYLLTLYLL